ncbi:MAG: hypothetical protein IT378_12635 [Sandaracinaceae bacterium]|nr:hypothetical protein [Sandaracinaceae bacterium]
MRRALYSLALLLLTACGGSAPSEPQTESQATSGGERAAAPQGDPNELVRTGTELIREGRCVAAIHEGFAPAVRAFEAQAEPGVRVLASRAGGAGALMALLMAAAEQQNAVVVGPEWPDAIYMHAFCLVELQRFDEAAQLLERALAMMPNDVVYSCELGHIMQQRQDWRRSMQLYQGALENVGLLEQSGAFTAEDTIFGQTLSDWRRRALRGIGFTQIELGELDAATETYRQVLAIDPSDERALHELRVIDERRRGL